MGRLDREVVVVVGHTGYGKTLWTAGHARGLNRVLIVERWADKSEYGHVSRFSELRELIAFFERRPRTFRVSYYPATMAEARYLWMLAWLVGDLTVVIEEADTYFPRGVIPAEFIELTGRGRHRQISLVVVSRTPYRLPIEIRREADRLIAFHLAERRDRAWVADFPGSSAETAEEIRQLDRLEYRQIERSGRILHGKVRVHALR